MSRRPSPSEVDGEAQERRGHELRLPERPRPGPVQLLGRHVATVDDLQRRHQFGAEIIGPLAETDERRQRLHERALAHVHAEIRLDPPDRCEHIPADAVRLLGARERASFFRHRRLAVRDALFVDEARHIIPDRRLELRLLPSEVEHLHVRLQSVEGDVERAARNPGPLPVDPQRGETGGKIRPRRNGERNESRGRA